MFSRDGRPPAARAHRPVPNPAKAITAKLERAIPQPQRPDDNDMQHKREDDTVNATAVETARIITVSQICEGDLKCYCGADAVLVVDTEPDNDPGPTCYAHGLERILFVNSIIGNLFAGHPSGT